MYNYNILCNYTYYIHHIYCIIHTLYKQLKNMIHINTYIYIYMREKTGPQPPISFLSRCFHTRRSCGAPFGDPLVQLP